MAGDVGDLGGVVAVAGGLVANPEHSEWPASAAASQAAGDGQRF